MTIGKALEMLKAIKESGEYEGEPDDSSAIALGIEALRRIIYLRLDMDCPHWMTLPGETKD